MPNNDYQLPSLHILNQLPEEFLSQAKSYGGSPNFEQTPSDEDNDSNNMNSPKCEEPVLFDGEDRAIILLDEPGSSHLVETSERVAVSVKKPRRRKADIAMQEYPSEHLSEIEVRDRAIADNQRYLTAMLDGLYAPKTQSEWQPSVPDVRLKSHDLTNQRVAINVVNGGKNPEHLSSEVRRKDPLIRGRDLRPPVMAPFITPGQYSVAFKKSKGVQPWILEAQRAIRLTGLGDTHEKMSFSNPKRGPTPPRPPKPRPKPKPKRIHTFNRGLPSSGVSTYVGAFGGIY